MYDDWSVYSDAQARAEYITAMSRLNRKLEREAEEVDALEALWDLPTVLGRYEAQALERVFGA